MRTAKVDFDGRLLSMQGPEQMERLGIRSAYPWDKFSESLFAQMGTMHLIAPYLPTQVETNFYIDWPVLGLIEKMYESEHKKSPGFLLRPRFDPPTRIFTSKRKVAIAYSAGKDSMWNLMWAVEEYGVDNVLVVHIKGLNKNNGPDEAKHVLKQQKKLGFKHLEVIELHNGSLNTGYKIMRSRDMFLAGVVMPVAIQFGASQIIMEGFADAKPTEPFSGLESNMVYFNKVISQLGIPVQVNWRNYDEMLTIKDLFEKRPEWMPHLCNCFTITCYRGSHKRTFQKSMPTFKLYDSQCGVCVKCRITNVARVLYDPSMTRTRPRDIRTFLEKTDAWIRSQYKAREKGENNHVDMIEGPFLRDFKIACQGYGIPARSLREVQNA